MSLWPTFSDGTSAGFGSGKMLMPIETVTASRSPPSLVRPSSCDLLAQALAEDARAVLVDAADEHGELLAAVARQHVLGAQGVVEHADDRAQHVVADEVAVRVVELLEVVDVEHEQRQRLGVALGEADLGAEPLEEVAAVERAGEPVAQRRLEQLPLRPLLDRVVAGELEHRRLADADLHALLEHALLHALAVDVGAVLRAEIGQERAVGDGGDARVTARDALVLGQAQVRLGVAADDDLAVDGEDLAEVRAGDHHQARALRPLHVAGQADQGRGVGLLGEAARWAFGHR